MEWLGSARADLRAFPEAARREAGHELFLVQLGEEPSDWKPLPAIGMGVNELRIHTGTEHRVIYIAKFAEAVYVLHAFEKRSRKTRPADLQLARQRFASLLRLRHEL
ncbi:MAG: type II toxin-antitoxin system RelE/ParE family toxin [Gemmatimonadales bacterium]